MHCLQEKCFKYNDKKSKVNDVKNMYVNKKNKKIEVTVLKSDIIDFKAKQFIKCRQKSNFHINK